MNPYFADQPETTVAQPTQPTPEPTPVAPIPKKSKKKIIIIAGSALLLLIIAGALFLVLGRGSSGAYADSLPYVYAKPQLNIDPTTKFEFTAKYDVKALQSYKESLTNNQYSDAVEVYTDEALTKPAADAQVTFSGEYSSKADTITIKAKPGSGVNGSIIGQSTTKIRSNGWGFYEEYYLVQKLDEKGKELKKPIVTRFSAKPATKLTTPIVNNAVDGDGIGHLTWQKIDGATKYYVVKITNGTESIIGSTTDKTEWTTAEQDTALQSSIAAGETIIDQNFKIRSFSNSQDDIQSKATFGGYLNAGNLESAKDKKETQYGVVAVSGETDFSAYGWFSGSSFDAQLPVQQARNAQKELSTKSEDGNYTFDTLPKQTAITMAGGVTALRQVVIQPEKATISNVVVATVNDAGKTISSRPGIQLNVSYKIEGTLMTGTYKISDAHFNRDSYTGELNRIAKRNLETRPTTGVATFQYQNEPADLSKVTASTTAPATDYKINATNTLTKYLAANMIAGKEFIDIKKFMEADTRPGAYDALEEAITQNPYVIGVKDYYYYRSENIIEVRYSVDNAAREKAQKEIAAEVPKVIAKVIKAGMSDREKAKAINDYLVETASYDREGFERAISFLTLDPLARGHSAVGVLVDKKGVCDSYSLAFKALADAAGLQAVNVTGTTDGSPYGHAWNKVKMDGKWQVVDPTFNDSDFNEKNQYFGITDAAANRLEDGGFVLDPFIRQYAAN